MSETAVTATVQAIARVQATARPHGILCNIRELAEVEMPATIGMLTPAGTPATTRTLTTSKVPATTGCQ